MDLPRNDNLGWFYLIKLIFRIKTSAQVIQDSDYEVMEAMEENLMRVAQTILAAGYVTCLTGAGISVESGIRPFRGPGGLWTEHGEPPMDGYQRFLADPKGHWEAQLKREGYMKEMAATIENARPNPAHFALAELEQLGVLRFLITQNVDNLHRAAGSKNLAEIHGNTRLLRCINCGARFKRSEIEIKELPPHCPACNGIIKGDGVMFGEPIPADVLEACDRESRRSDLMLLVGTSAFVYPAIGFAIEIKKRGGILVEVNPNRTDITKYCDIRLEGKAGEVMPQLVAAIKSLKEK